MDTRSGPTTSTPPLNPVAVWLLRICCEQSIAWRTSGWLGRKPMLHAVALLLCLLFGGATPALADDHAHTEGSTVWAQPSCVRGCCSQSGYAPCTYAGCSFKYPKHRTTGDCPPPPPPPREGSFGGGGASGQYSTGLSMSLDLEPMSHATPVGAPWSPRPGSSRNDECPPHDLGDEKCGPWGAVTPTCKVRHCTRKCRKCGTNTGDRHEEDPDGCLGG